jgi:hypothetical protein
VEDVDQLVVALISKSVSFVEVAFPPAKKRA